MITSFPYPGLRPFRREETDIFFGREEQVDQLLGKLEHSRFLAVVGPSGCGKSSLVRAGMIGALETGFMASAGAHWRVAEMRPGNRPLRNLAEALLTESALKHERGGDGDTVAFLHATLRRGPLGLVEVLSETPLPERTNLLLLVDQFEEIFRYRREGGSDEADAFVALLLTTAAQPEMPVYVIITMRSEYLGDCALFSGLPEAINESQFLTPRLTREQQRDAILGPAAVFGGAVEPDLVNRLLNDMGPDPDQLPLMQHVLMRMWTRASDDTEAVNLALEDYREVGGLAEALSKHANEAFKELDEKQQHIAEVLFRCLSERGADQREARRPVQLEVVKAVAGASVEDVVKVVEVFRRPGRNFITPPVGTALYPDTVLDISHECLIRQWDRLNRWVKQESASAETYRRLEQTACLWKTGQAAPWGTPDLENALAWRAREKPTPAWAERYGNHFQLAMEFLDASEREREEERQREEKARQRELAQARALADEQQRRAEAERQRAEEQQRRADAERQRAEEQQRRADAERQRAEVQARSRRRMRRLAAALAVVVLLALGAAVFASLQRQEAENQRQKAEKAKEAEEKQRQIAQYQAELAQEKRKEAEKAKEAEAEQRLFAESQAKLAQEKRKEAEKAREAEEKQRQIAVQQAKLAEEKQKEAEEAKKKEEEQRQIAVQQAKLAEEKRIEAEQAKAAEAEQRWIAEAAARIAEEKRIEAEEAASDARKAWAAEAAQRQIVLARNLAIQADLASGLPSDLRLLLAVESVKRLPSPENVQALRNRLAQSGSASLAPINHQTYLYSAVFSSDGKYLATAGNDDMAVIWEVSSGKEVFRANHGSGLNSVAFSSDDEYLATAGGDGIAVVWEVSSGKKVRRVNHGRGVNSVVFGPNDKYLATAGNDRAVRIWEVSSGKELARMGYVGGVVDSVAFSPDGKYIASAGEGGIVCIRRVSSGRSFRIMANKGKINSICFSPDGKHLATAGDDKTIRIWEIFGKREKLSISHDGPVYSVALSPDGEHLAAACKDGTARIWDASKGLEVARMDHQDEVYSVCFSPDGRCLATASKDKTARVWFLSPEDLLARAGTQLKRQLTPDEISKYIGVEGQDPD